MQLPIERPAFAAAPTLVGSFPHADPKRLIDRILGLFADLPAWPQMPARDWRESMYVQYSEGLPGAVVDSQERRIYFRRDENFYGDLEKFHQAVLEEDVDCFAISPGFALGLHLDRGRRPRAGDGNH